MLPVPGSLLRPHPFAHSEMAAQTIAATKASTNCEQVVLTAPCEASSSQDEKQEYISSGELPLETFDDHDV